MDIQSSIGKRPMEIRPWSSFLANRLEAKGIMNHHWMGYYKSTDRLNETHENNQQKTMFEGVAASPTNMG